MSLSHTYAWKRFWCLREGTFTQSDEGYLVDPEASGGKYTQREAVSFDQISTFPCLALLGEPGIGKSHVLSSQSVGAAPLPQGVKRLSLNLNEFSSETRLHSSLFGSEVFMAWRGGDHILEVFLDSLDECLVHIKTVAAMLAEELKLCPRERLRLRIACRTAEWPLLLDERLGEMWGATKYAAYELLPLRKADIAVAAQAETASPDQFLSLVEQYGLVPFAIKPMTLRMLLQAYVKEGTLPEDRAKLYGYFTEWLASESSYSRRASGSTGAVNRRRRILVAERLAAIMRFGNKASILTEDLPQPGDQHSEDLTWEDAEGGEEIDGDLRVEVDTHALREVVGTGLFSGRGTTRMGWSHQTYADFLAARFLHRRRVASSQARALVLHPPLDPGDHPRIIPQLRETAAWLAVMSEDLLPLLVENDPQVLLRSATANSDFRVRKEIVSSLMKQAESGEIVDDVTTRHNYEVLSHPDLGTQLRSYVNNRNGRFVTRRMAIDIAEACDVRDLVGDLIRIVLDHTEEMSIREQAGHAILQIGDDGEKDELRPFLAGVPQDASDQLKGYALQALWPGQLSLNEMLGVIGRPRRSSFVGSYSTFLSVVLPRSFTPEQLPQVLAWSERQGRSHQISYAIRSLIEEALEKAWEHLEVKEVRVAFARIALAWLRNFDSVFEHRHGFRDKSKPLENTARRRLFVESLVNELGLPLQDLKYVLQREILLVRAEDVLWLLERSIRETDGGRKEAWQYLLRVLVNPYHPDFKEVRRNISDKKIDIGFSLPDELPPRTESSKDKKIGATHPPHSKLVQEWLAKYKAGDSNAWWLLNRDLTLPVDSDYYPPNAEFNPDLTELPGWKAITPELRKRCVEVAAEYLHSGDPNPKEWLGKDIFHRPAFAGYRALFLLRSEDPSQLDRLPKRLWKVWASIIIGYPDDSRVDAEYGRKELTERAYRYAPDECIAALGAMLQKENARHKQIFSHRRMEHVWDGQLSRYVEHFIRKSKDLAPGTLRELFSGLLEHGDRKAFAFAKRYVRLPLSRKKYNLLLSRMAARALLRYGGNEEFELVWSVLSKKHSFGKGVILDLCQMREQAVCNHIIHSVSECNVAKLLEWLFRAFPSSEDPRHDDAHWVGSRESAGMFRDSLLARLRDKGTKESYESIVWLHRKLKYEWLVYTRTTAREAALRNTWVGILPEQFLKLSDNPESRVVTTGYELVEVLVESLKRLERSLHGDTPAVADLWNEDKTPRRETHLSNYIKRHLTQDLRGRGLVVNREVEVRLGQKTDIHVVAVVPGRGKETLDPVKVVIEVKCSWNRDLRTAMKVQLLGKYLAGSECSCGLYLVGWYRSPHWKQSDRRRTQGPKWSLNKAQTFFSSQAKAISKGGVFVGAYVLNAALP